MPSARSLLGVLVLLVVALWTRPKEGLFGEAVTEKRVWYFGLITALSTGLGALPFVCVSEPNKILLGSANAVAAGMMMSASVGLLVQGCRGSESQLNDWSAVYRTAAGTLFGLCFILAAKVLLEKHEDTVKFDNMSSLSAKKVLLVVFVMTLHSFSEGVGIGVSFAGNNGKGSSQQSMP